MERPAARVNYQPPWPHDNETGVDFTWAREWRWNGHGKGLPIILGREKRCDFITYPHDLPLDPEGAILVEWDDDVTVVVEKGIHTTQIDREP